MLPPLPELLAECERQHGHICPGQLLGARMAVLGCRLVGLKDPRGVDRKKLLVWVEIDRCMTDAISAVAGVRLGRRSLKFMDYGKVAATFYNIETRESVRVAAKESSRAMADELYPDLETKKERQMRAYMEASDIDLFQTQRVSIEVSELDLPGRPKRREECVKCHEGVNDGKEVRDSENFTLCRTCAAGGYYSLAVCADAFPL